MVRKVVVSLPNNQVGVDLRQQGKNLTVEFLRSSLPEGLRRRLDVTDFGTPVQLITATQRVIVCACSSSRRGIGSIRLTRATTNSWWKCGRRKLISPN